MLTRMGKQRQIVGIIGAGQLARMLIEAATALDIDIALLAASPDDGAARIWPNVTIGSPADAEAVAAFAAACDVVTFDHELVPEPVLARLEAAGVSLAPTADTMRIAQNKQRQRGLFGNAGLPQPRHRICTTPDDAQAAAREIGFPVIVKAAQGGYDGRGVWRIGDERGLADVAGHLHESGITMIVEECVPLDRELAILVARDRRGETAVYPLVETVQDAGICRQITLDRTIDPALTIAATGIAVEVAELVSLIGILAVELFESGGRLLVNEIATRPHNSGHYSIEAIATSQFEQHLRAILELPLGSMDRTADVAVTVNVLGGSDGVDPRERLSTALAVPGVHVHLYGKEARPGRKLGHVTTVGTSVEECANRAWAAVEALTNEPRPEVRR
jgi:5-(carboxyamino)imidazole ribonucleotide synthase